MRQDAKFWEAVKQIREKDSRFKPEAYSFVMESLDHTLRRLGEHRHVSAEELLQGLCDHAKERFGLLAHTVVESWGVTSAGDIGRVVYHLVEAGVLAKQVNDRYEDFDQDYDLKEILEERYFD
jgi:uncharacterized repeat protein (TIGR04138 family)